MFEFLKSLFGGTRAGMSAKESIRNIARDELHRLLADESYRAAQSAEHEQAARRVFHNELNQLTEAARRTEWLAHVNDVRTELLRRQLRTQLLLARALWRAHPPANAGSVVPLRQNLNDILAQLRALHPHLFERWQKANFVDSAEEFAKRPEASCTIGKREADEPFSGFVAPYLNGRVLDVGCGPYATPMYLREYPVELIYGVDPLEPFEPHPFTFVRAFAEWLPFPDASFDVVIAATSLDHSLSLDRSLAEVRRVIKPGGRFLIWDGFVKGAPRYNPSDPDLVPIDAFHLFHFDEPWFEDIMREHGFAVSDKLVYDPSPHNPQYSASYFYCLEAATAPPKSRT